jgi:dipeptidyl aminopeptidase/acylaminoacyl peptidase
MLVFLVGLSQYSRKSGAPMNSSARETVVASLFLLLPIPAAFGQSLPPVEAFAQLPSLSEPRLSPDGQHFAAIQMLDGKPAVAIYPVDGPPGAKPSVVPSEGDWLIRGIKWAKNDRLVVFLGQNKKVYWDKSNKLQSWGRAVTIGTDANDAAILFKDNPSLSFNYGASRIVDLDVADPDNIFMPIWSYSNMRSPSDEAFASKSPAEDADDDLFRYDLYQVNVRTGASERAATGGHDTADWFLDGSGHVIARIDQTKQPLVDHLKLFKDNAWQEIASYEADADNGAGVAGVTEDGKALVRFARDNQGMQVLYRMDLGTGKEALLYSNPNYDVDVLKEDDWTARVVGVGYVADEFTISYFDPKREALQRGLEKAFPGLAVIAVSADVAQDRLIVAAEGPRSPTTYYFLDRTTHQAASLGSTYPDLKEADLGVMKPYPYKARDGLDIPAYMTLPPGRAARNLPAVVMPHGGPDARDSLGFDWWAQFLADRGYVVLQPNYRGSSGYGHKFTEAGLHQWGLKMQDDITDGVKKMIADGIADPKRVCIVGASYGGYAALAGAALTPDLYACAVSVAGVSDLPAMIRDERQRYGKNSGDLSFWISRIGSPYDDSDQLRATSPARNADKVKCPVLLLHGDGDTTVPIRQSELMYDALKSAGKDAQFVRLEGDDHSLALESSRVRILSETEKFLAAHIGNAPVAQK